MALDLPLCARWSALAASTPRTVTTSARVAVDDHNGEEWLTSLDHVREGHREKGETHIGEQCSAEQQDRREGDLLSPLRMGQRGALEEQHRAVAQRASCKLECGQDVDIRDEAERALHPHVEGEVRREPYQYKEGQPSRHPGEGRREC
eukprot:scaffold45276_cov281-Isochrysis_galbana.AAC.1